jgi:hypothetical protein
MRELLWMAEGLGRQHWAHTSALCAVLANTNRSKKQRPYSPDDFNPYATKTSRPGVIEVNPENIGLLREAFTGRKGT